MEEVTIKLDRIAEALVTSYKFNSEEVHHEVIIAYKMILSEDEYKEVAQRAKKLLAENK